eukprot:CAMPEP_0194333870 /NCGR_PEP_ID=MMETSP0171-20130528/64228_1 /TAXON_ID=218684 /ORGANISM="Corethron pennatum, Strain L29A3" /LENGTH=470 /DNA_ID=CAMNT_0039096287 /DNA_START=592 /DNA_END=2004 /DNA_ORIENTATION=+
MTISAGCAVGMQVAKLSLFEEEMDERMVLNFGCPNIGIGGTLGSGGQGYFSGYLGLQLDRVKEATFLVYNRTGEVLEVIANKRGEHKHLFWAAGGGQGGYGILTELTLQTAKSPSVNAVTWIDLFYGSESHGIAWYRFQQLVLSVKRFGISQTNRMDVDGSQIRVSFLGTTEKALQLLKKAGMLEMALLDTEGAYSKTASESSWLKNYEEICKGTECAQYGLPRRGVNVFEYPNFREFTAMAWINPATVNTTGICGSAYGFDCHPIDGLNDQHYFISKQVNALKILDMAGEPSSDFLEPMSPFWKSLPRSIFQMPGYQWRMTKEGWMALTDLRASSDASGCKYSLLFTHATGGVAAKQPKKKTAYFWRGWPLLSFVLGDVSGMECAEFVKAVTEVRKEYVVNGYPNDGGAYIGYPGNPNNCCQGDYSWKEMYYGGNYKKLQRMRTLYDPLHIYSKLQLPEPKKTCKRVPE